MYNLKLFLFDALLSQLPAYQQVQSSSFCLNDLFYRPSPWINIWRSISCVPASTIWPARVIYFHNFFVCSSVLQPTLVNTDSNRIFLLNISTSYFRPQFSFTQDRCCINYKFAGSFSRYLICFHCFFQDSPCSTFFQRLHCFYL